MKVGHGLDEFFFKNPLFPAPGFLKKNILRVYVIVGKENLPY
jgi:hypothetical protein